MIQQGTKENQRIQAMSNKIYKFIRKIRTNINISKIIEKVSMVIAMLSAFLAFYSIFYSSSFITPKKSNEDISTRIEKISNNLAEASSELSNIQEELEARIEYVENLKKEAEIAENLISMTDEQVNAVQAKINQELNASSGKSFFQSIAISAFFFALGLIIQPISKTIKKKFGKKTKNDSSTSYDNKYTDNEIAQAIRLLETINQNKTSHDN